MCRGDIDVSNSRSNLLRISSSTNVTVNSVPTTIIININNKRRSINQEYLRQLPRSHAPMQLLLQATARQGFNI